MKHLNFTFFAFFLLLISCNTGVETTDTLIVDDEIPEVVPAAPMLLEMNQLAPILDTIDVDGSVVIFNADSNAYWGINFDRANQGYLPASTFKIVNSIIALETGVIPNRDTVFVWDGEPKRLQAWEQDLTFEHAFHVSCVHCYQQIARMIGPERMNEYLNKFDYGNMIVNDSTIDVFWLEGESQVNQMQQLEFLRKFYYKELPISENTYEEMKALMVINKNDEYTISGKTGWSIRNGNNIGWFVGYLETDGTVYFVATNIEPQENFSMDLFPMTRNMVSMRAFQTLDIID